MSPSDWARSQMERAERDPQHNQEIPPHIMERLVLESLAEQAIAHEAASARIQAAHLAYEEEQRAKRERRR